MTDDVLSMDEAMRLLRKEVANKGEDFVYKPLVMVDELGAEIGTRCVYVDKGQPSCLVGHGLVDYGVSVQALENLQCSAYYLPHRDMPLTQSAADVFQAAQNVQDAGGSWGSALEAAEAKYRALGGTE